VSTLRQDPTNKEWVILAPRRAARSHLPEPRSRPPQPRFDAVCPFCPGNEHQTPPEIVRTMNGSAGDDRWSIRVVPNLFPALDGEGSTERRGGPAFREMGGVGRHEVVIESQDHDARLDEMGRDEVADVVRMWRERYRDLKRRPWARAVVVFKNFGIGAGTSLHHAHSQIVATPVFPPESLLRFAVATRYYDDTGHCVYDDLIDRERQAGTRVVAERGRLVALNPFASATPFETWIAPTVHQSSFGQLEDDDVEDLAALIGDVLGGVRTAAGDPDFNLVIASAPAHEEGKPFFLWHVKVLPRITTAAGFELGSGMSINTVVPEDAADALRTAIAAVRPA
jgi:UDPglucose--hexose-1-phosphate uridylyltransferase